ncbi:MAG: hypothetical protein WBH40_07075, partial [Ignavibacteriaceae bacterium]
VNVPVDIAVSAAAPPVLAVPGIIIHPSYTAFAPRSSKPFMLRVSLEDAGGFCIGVSSSEHPKKAII